MIFEAEWRTKWAPVLQYERTFSFNDFIKDAMKDFFVERLRPISLPQATFGPP